VARSNIACRVSFHAALWHRELVIARCANGCGARFKFTPFVCIAFRRITSWCKSAGLNLALRLRSFARAVALVALSAENCASAVAPCIPSASVLAIARRRKFSRSSRSKPTRLRYAAIEPKLCYDRTALNFTACRDGDCGAGLAPRTVPVSASKFCYNAPRKRPRRFDIVCRVGVRALWHREFVIARCANGCGADLDAMFAAR